MDRPALHLLFDEIHDSFVIGIMVLHKVELLRQVVDDALGEGGEGRVREIEREIPRCRRGTPGRMRTKDTIFKLTSDDRRALGYKV